MDIAKLSRSVLGSVAADVIVGALLGAAARKVSSVSKPLFGSMIAGAALMITASGLCGIFEVIGQHFFGLKCAQAINPFERVFGLTVGVKELQRGYTPEAFERDCLKVDYDLHSVSRLRQAKGSSARSAIIVEYLDRRAYLEAIAVVQKSISMCVAWKIMEFTSPRLGIPTLSLFRPGMGWALTKAERLETKGLLFLTMVSTCLAYMASSSLKKYFITCL
ncbi:MAG: hypothetical protein LVR00_04605 [Rhabdochlamydiaceae bacterium]|jgi:hypothetical protein